ncbi:MAG: GNAT family N-acetyltransferase [Chloroflexota bacterium]
MAENPDHSGDYATPADDNLLIHDALPKDHDAVVSLTLSANMEYVPVLSLDWWRAYSQNVIETLAAGAPGTSIVAELSGGLVGSVLLLPAEVHEAGWPEIRLLAVDPRARGRRIASTLMAECLRRVRLQGAPTLGIHTMELMTTARRLYERLGFVRAPEHDFDPGVGPVVQGYRLDLDQDPRRRDVRGAGWARCGELPEAVFDPITPGVS